MRGHLVTRWSGARAGCCRRPGSCDRRERTWLRVRISGASGNGRTACSGSATDSERQPLGPQPLGTVVAGGTVQSTITQTGQSVSLLTLTRPAEHPAPKRSRRRHDTRRHTCGQLAPGGLRHPRAGGERGGPVRTTALGPSLDFVVASACHKQSKAVWPAAPRTQPPGPYDHGACHAMASTRAVRDGPRDSTSRRRRRGRSGGRPGRVFHVGEGQGHHAVASALGLVALQIENGRPNELENHFTTWWTPTVRPVERF